jgi:hypothetical protein
MNHKANRAQKSFGFDAPRDDDDQLREIREWICMTEHASWCECLQGGRVKLNVMITYENVNGEKYLTCPRCGWNTVPPDGNLSAPCRACQIRDQLNHPGTVRPGDGKEGRENT